MVPCVNMTERRIWHSEDRASWYIPILKPTRCTISQFYFGKDLYILWTDLLSIIRSLNTVFRAIGICHTEILKMGKIASVYTSTCTLLLNCKACCIFWNVFTILSFLYNIEFHQQHVLKFNNIHVYTPVILPIFKISAWQIPIAVNTVSRVLMMDSIPSEIWKVPYQDKVDK